MQAVCPKCKHQWQATVDAATERLECPACGVGIRIRRKPAPARPQPPAPSRAPAPKPDPTAQTQAPAAPQSGSFEATAASIDPEATGAPSARPGASASQTHQQSKVAEEMKGIEGRTLGGYQVREMLGAGGMGAVFRARQISLDRDVALKVLPPRYADKPEALARFTREALSAAQLNHHNVVQVYDVDGDAGQNFIAMEYVRGKSLGDLVREDGRLMVDTAAGYILQAARGLHYAHRHGIVHRDIKPDNLMLNEHGVVKVADMGLAKMVGALEKAPRAQDMADELKKSSAELTLAHRGMGTPAYMPPEQARDASSVGPQADQYSLGCTLYYLCTGKAPYSGTTAFEMITKHIREPVTPIETHLGQVPEAFKHILDRMLQKKPENRYPDLGEAIKDIEGYLGLDAESGGFAAREQHLKQLEAAQEGFYAVPVGRLRRPLQLGFAAVCLALMLLAIFSGGFALAGGILGLFLLTPVATFLLDGALSRGYHFRRLRSVFFGMPLRSWALTLGGSLLGLAALYVLGWLPYWIGFAVLAGGLAAGYEFGFLKKLRAERQEFVDQLHGLLRDLRLRGMSEEALQDFVCRFSGRDWEELFETIFGYEAMLHARNRSARADDIEPRRKFATWRDPLARKLDEIEEQRRQARERRRLEKAEAKRLKAEGLSGKEAEAQARREADDFVAEEKKKKDKRKKDDEPDVTKVAALSHPRSRLPLVLRLLRLAGALLVLSVWAGHNFGLASMLPEFLKGPLETVFAAGQAGSFVIGGACGLLLLATVFSSRVFTPTLALAGAMAVAFQQPLVTLAHQPNLTPQTTLWGGLILVAAGFGLCVLGKLSGGKF